MTGRAPTKAWASLAGALTLSQRLTLLFVAAATLVLLLLGGLVTRSVEQHFEDLDMEVLAGKMALIEQGLQTVTSPDALTAFTHQLARSLVGHHGLEVMLIDATGSVIFATAQAGFETRAVLALAQPSPRRPALWSLGQHSYRTIAERLPLAARDNAGQPLQVVVLVATDIGHHQDYMRALLRTLWMFVAAAAGLLGVLGWLAVRRGLAPLRLMRKQAQGVSAQQLNQRLPAQSLPPELSELAQSLNDMLARLEVAFGRLSDFSSDIAHELRTPLSNLLTQTQVTLSRPRSADEYRSALESNAEELEHLSRMVADMLLLAKADNGLAVPSREPVDLRAEVNALLAYFEPLAAEKALALVLDGAAGVVADRLMLRRAIANLLSNAVRHATEATVVTVRLKAGDEAIRIEVENQGDPIAPEFLARVFDRFFRVDPSRQRNPEGTGLGLAITRSIVAAHGGTIAVSSSTQATCFCITLPNARALAPA